MFHILWNNVAGKKAVIVGRSPGAEKPLAMRSIIKFARDWMHIKQINACIYPENRRSVILSEKLGFAYYGETKNEFFRGAEYKHKIYTLYFVS